MSLNETALDRNALMAAYSRTLFEAETPSGKLVLQVGEQNNQLQDLYRRLQVHESAYITAWNPGSRPTSTTENDRAHTELLKTIQEAGTQAYQGFGRDPAGDWEPERSLLILGISEPAAVDIGKKFGQAAIVVAGPDAVPRLLWLGDDRDEAEEGRDSQREISPIDTRRLLLDHYQSEQFDTVWCWKDLDTHEASQEFESEEAALKALRDEAIEWSQLLD